MLTIIRSLPCSGKSTLARKMAAECKALFLEPDIQMYQGGVTPRANSGGPTGQRPEFGEKFFGKNV